MCVCVRGSAFTPLRGGLARDSMETLSERVSVRERAVGRKFRGGERERKKREEQMERRAKRERCVTPDDNVVFLSSVRGRGEQKQDDATAVPYIGRNVCYKVCLELLFFFFAELKAARNHTGAFSYG